MAALRRRSHRFGKSNRPARDAGEKKGGMGDSINIGRCTNCSACSGRWVGRYDGPQRAHSAQSRSLLNELIVRNESVLITGERSLITYVHSSAKGTVHDAIPGT